MNPTSGAVPVAALLLELLMPWWKRKPTERWPLEKPVYWLTPNDPLDLGSCTRGLLVTGNTGSGKTSGPGNALTSALMQMGCGLLALVAKEGDYARIKHLADKAGRGDDVIRVAPGTAKYDALAWAMQSREGSSSMDAARLLEQLMELATRSQGGHGGDNAYWFQSSAKCLRYGLDALRLAYGSATVPALYRMVVDAAFREQVLGKLSEGHDAALAKAYWQSEFVGVGDKTRGIITSMVCNTLEPFQSEIVRDMISAGTMTVDPSMPMDGKIIVVDMPYLIWKSVGQLCSAMWKIQVQWEVLRRKVTKDIRPVVCLMDEAHFQAMPEHDVMVQTVARESRLINIALVQSLPVLTTAFGGGDKRAMVEAWVGNLAVKLICSNSCNDTNNFYANLIGKERKRFWGGGSNPQHFDHIDDLMFGSQPANVTFNEQLHYILEPSDFATSLRTGGKENRLTVDCYVHLAGRIFSNGKQYLKASFKQG